MAPLHGHFQSVLSLIQVNPKAGVGERSKAVTCWWTTKRHGISLSKLFSEVEHSHSIYPLKPSCPATEKAFAGQGLCWLTALHGHSRAGWSWQSKKCILSGFLASSAKHLQKMFWEGRGKKKKGPLPHFIVIKIYLICIQFICFIKMLITLLKRGETEQFCASHPSPCTILYTFMTQHLFKSEPCPALSAFRTAHPPLSSHS